jgi:hypothetical protein
MALMLDALGERYGMLPSQVLECASTLDLWIYDAAVSYINSVQQKGADGNRSASTNYDQELLRKKMESVRGR